MAINIKQNADASGGLQGTDYDEGPIIFVSSEYTASSVDKVFFVAPRRCIVKGITWRVTAAGTDGSAVTAEIKSAASGTAITSGTVLHSGTANLKGTANTNQALTLSTTAANLDIAAGTAIGIDFTGTLTTATGVVTVALCPA
jgi:hypothetical protein